MGEAIQILVYEDINGKRPWVSWLKGLRDARAVLRIESRIMRMASGNFGYHKSIGSGLFEARIDYGPGYRIYYARYGNTVVLLLGGGDKNGQEHDINDARIRKADYEERK